MRCKLICRKAFSLVNCSIPPLSGISAGSIKALHYGRLRTEHCPGTTTPARSLSKLHVNMPTTREDGPVKITSPVFRCLLEDTPELKKLAEIFKERGYELRMAGGAVRDILMGIRPVDIDLATVATPIQMREMFEEKQIRMINTNGEKHGTVTARIDDKENFEVTTLRIDKVTDGRWAQVEFTQDWELDASRRDLTINSMFLDLDGNLYDYFNGREDLTNRRVRFVGDPAKRIQEDFLRILRYLRFYGRISDKPDNHDEETLEAIRQNSVGLKRISGERLWMELRKIVVGRFADAVIRRMLELGIGKYLGFPENPNVDEMERVWKLAEELQPAPATMLASLLHSDPEVDVLNARIKMSNEDCDIVRFILKTRTNPELLNYCATVPDGDPVVPYKRLMAVEILTSNPKVALRRCEELLKYRGDKHLIERLQAWEVPRFPISGTMLLENGVAQGPQTGRMINELRKAWFYSDFQKTPEELLNNDLPIIKQNLSDEHVRRSSLKRMKKETKVK